MRGFTIDEVLGWADAWKSRTGECPTAACGEIPGAGGLNWAIVDEALREGRGGLLAGCSLGRLLVMERFVETRPRISEEQILVWADSHYERRGRWPKTQAVALLEAPDETWSAISFALFDGRRGLRGGSSLLKLLVAARQVRARQYAPPLEIPRIVEWAKAFHARTKRWPNQRSGAIQEAAGETWQSVQNSLVSGRRGLPGGSSLTRVLVEHGLMRHAWHMKPLTIDQIVKWADAFHAKTGEWPNQTSGPVPDAPHQQWSSIDRALRVGHRGLPGGTSLFQLLALHRGDRDPKRFSGAAANALSRKSRLIGARSAIEHGIDPKIAALLANEHNANRTRRERVDPRIEAFLAQERNNKQSRQGQERAAEAG